MYKRVSAALFVLAMGVGACGGDDDTAASGGGDSCTATMQSIPSSPADPCPQTDPKCPATMYHAIATCGMDGKWTKGPDGAIACACLLKGGAAGNTVPVMMCGNNKIEGDEQCDGTDLKGASCMTLNPGSMGVLRCTAMCRYDVTTCIATPTMSMTGMGGQGGGSSGSGT